jgi:glycogen debranching enzyme
MTDPNIADIAAPLPHGTTSVLRGSTFALSDERGDVVPGGVWGVFHEDTRMLSEFAMEVDGRRPFLLSSAKTAPHAARIFTALRDRPTGGLSIMRRRVVSERVLEDITVHSHRQGASQVTLRLRFAADFADVFEVKSGSVPSTGTELERLGGGQGGLRFRTTRPGVDRSTVVSFSEPPTLEDGEATFLVDLPAGGSWNVRITVGFEGCATAHRPAVPDAAAEVDEPELAAARDMERWFSSFPVLRASSDTLERMYRQAIEDLAALRLTIQPNGEPLTLPAAGLPWFMTIFGRDTLITAYEALPFAPRLAEGALGALARLQGARVDERHDEEPGKILHEIRSGPLTVSGALPYDPYYGTVDATPLWLVLLSEHERWTGDASVVDDLWPNTSRALAWIDDNLARSVTGYVEYRTRSPVGLANQGWKDSWDAVSFHDGTLAEAPIALVEVQGYVFDAWRRTADLAGRVMGDRALERELLERANRLERTFHDDFWLEERGGFYAMGLDADRRRIDTMTSNMGHLLWSGLVPPERLPAIVEQLFSPSMWSGWGVRTLSADEASYDPVGYHVGSVWPHDNALIADGLGRWGSWDDARRIARAMITAAGQQEARLPEAIAGYDRAESIFPVRYPMASSPQAWATASTFVWIRSMLGLQAHDEPEWSGGDDRSGWISLEGVAIRGERIDIRVGEPPG